MGSSNLQREALSCHHVIGGGNSAAEEATYLMNKITVSWNTVAVECQGDGDPLNDLRIKNTLTGHESDLPAKGLFYAIGHEPVMGLVRDQLRTDADGYIITVPGTTSSYTSVRGVFVAGDVQDKRYRQAVTNAWSGSWRL